MIFDESERIRVLRDFAILDTAAEPILDDLTRLASEICQTPISYISLIDSERLWFKSKVGIRFSEIPRSHSFCAHAIPENDPMFVEDAALDPRFSSLPWVAAIPPVRFYAGVPLIVRGTYRLGCLCVMDHEPRRLLGPQKDALQMLARHAVHFLEARHDLAEARQTTSLREEALSTCSRLVTLGELASQICHEIKNPLAVIQILSEQLAESLQENPPGHAEAVEMAQQITSTTGRIDKIILGLTRLSRNEVGDPAQLVDPRKIILESLSLCQPRFKKNSVRFEMDELPTGINIYCRPTEISQVVINLLNNAVDAVADSDVRWVRLSMKDEPDHIEISITDSGPGIPKDVIEKQLFRPYFTTKAAGKGTGIGLTLSRKILESHRGVLELDLSSPNTRFVGKIPKGTKE